MEQQQGKKRRAWQVALGKYKYALIVVLAGIVCLAWPSVSRDEQEKDLTEKTAATDDQVEKLQQEMEEILGHMAGVGQVRVLLTVDRGKETVLASDSTLSYSGATASPDDYSRTTDTVVLSGSDSGVVVTQEVWPRYRGALVVCQGGGDAAVQLSVIQAVSALTGLGSNKISVVQWQS